LVSWADLKDVLDPLSRLDLNNHILILSNMIRQINKTTNPATEPKFKCAEFLKNGWNSQFGRTHLGQYGTQPTSFIEADHFGLDTLYQCQKAKAEKRFMHPGYMPI